MAATERLLDILRKLFTFSHDVIRVITSTMERILANADGPWYCQVFISISISMCENCKYSLNDRSWEKNRSDLSEQCWVADLFHAASREHIRQQRLGAPAVKSSTLIWSQGGIFFYSGIKIRAPNGGGECERIYTWLISGYTVEQYGTRGVNAYRSFSCCSSVTSCGLIPSSTAKDTRSPHFGCYFTRFLEDSNIKTCYRWQ